MKSSTINYLLSKVEGFKDLKENFDSYNADKVSEKAIAISIEIVGQLKDIDVEGLSVFPMRDGGIQFEISRFSDIEEELIIDKEGNIVIAEYNTLGDLITRTPIKLEQIGSFFI